MIARADGPVRADASETFWLNRLKEAHANLINAVDELARLTLGPLPDKDVLIGTRWKVSDASLSRRLIWGRIHAHLSNRVDPNVERDLRHLQDMDARLIRTSATHVARWTAESITEDWPGYCRASELMRRQMIEAVGEERRLLYPLLDRFEREQKSVG